MLRPIGSRLLIEPLLAEDKTASGILLPETSQDKPQRGKVLAIGSGKILDNGNREAIELQIGNAVYFAKYSPTELKINNRETYIIDFNDVLAVEE